ncbi:MAG TPA: hypothetical protein VEJ42_08350 [Streptosporangiaceae bacterium]|nr:hypothetical protein [Streptosporangiaceae bacterium]
MTSETYYARRDEQSTTAGGVILAIAAFVSAILVIAGLAYAAGIGPRHQAALAAGGCEPNLSPSGLQCTTVWMLERQYTSMTSSAIQQLNADVADYAANEGRNLAAAETALTAQVTTGNALAASLAQFPFPPAVAPRASALIQAIRARVKLTAEQARSSSLAQMQSFNGQTQAAGVTIVTDLNLVRAALFTRPTASQEP